MLKLGQQAGDEKSTAALRDSFRGGPIAHSVRLARGSVEGAWHGRMEHRACILIASIEHRAWGHGYSDTAALQVDYLILLIGL
jgi:hypothetical protein